MTDDPSVSRWQTYLISYLSFGYAALAFFFCIPVYFGLFSARDMALVSLFLFFFPLMQNLDLGFGQTILREAANTAQDMSKSAELARSINGVETAALVLWGGIVVASCSGAIVWASIFGREKLLSALVIFAFCISLGGRWMALVYRNGALGLGMTEKISWNNVAFTTLRFAVPIPVLYYFGGAAVSFLLFQAVISVVEILNLRRMVSSLVPLSARLGEYSTVKNSLLKNIGFSGAVGAGGLIWMTAAQVDKIWLFMSAADEDYYRFSVAVLLASIVSFSISPISFVLLPSLFREANSNERASYHKLFRRGTVAVVIVGGSIASILTFFGREALWVWTGSELQDTRSMVLLACYGIANVFLAVSVFSHYAQITLNSLQLYLPGIAAFSSVFPILVLILTRGDQIEGAGFAWLISNVLYLILFSVFIIWKLLPTIAFRWFFVDVLWTLVTCFASGKLIQLWIDFSGSRFETAVFLAAVGALTLISATAASPQVSRSIYDRLKSNKRALNVEE